MKPREAARNSTEKTVKPREAARNNTVDDSDEDGEADVGREHERDRLELGRGGGDASARVEDGETNVGREHERDRLELGRGGGDASRDVRERKAKRDAAEETRRASAQEQEQEHGVGAGESLRPRQVGR